MNEKTPLLSSENPYRSVAHPFVEPAVQNVGDAQATINCQVCGHVIPITNQEKQIVVRCSECSEATPIKGPPAGKQFFRCPCNCLLVCGVGTTRIGCPRAGCQNVIILSEGDADYGSRTDGNAASHLPTDAGMRRNFEGPQSLRVSCGNCSSPFMVANTQTHSVLIPNSFISCLSGGSSAGAAGLIAARCPHCRKVTSVGPAYARVRLVIYGFLALLFFLIALSVTLGTVETAKENKALYFLWSVLYLITGVLGLRAIFFLVMPVSTFDVQLLNI